jgi:hypothetical protein
MQEFSDSIGLPTSYRQVTLSETLSQLQKLAAAFKPDRWVFSCCGKEACDGCAGPSALIKVSGDDYADFEKWAEVIAHVAGPSGSGKTTMLNQLSVKYPELVTKDLDDFDDAAASQLGWAGKRKAVYTDDMISTLAQRRQQLMDDFLKANQSSQVVLGGHHTEGPHALNLPTSNRFMLNTGAFNSAWRAYRRSQGEQADHRRRLTELPSDYREARKTQQELQGLGYQTKSPAEITAHVDQAQRPAAKRTAVLVTGNPAYIQNNPTADAFYGAIEKHLNDSGYQISRDPGDDYTMPTPADLWVGHSRGASRFRFAPKDQKYVAFGSSMPGAINHPDDTSMTAGDAPTPAHFMFTPEMAAAISSTVKAGGIEGETQSMALGDPYAQFFSLDDPADETEPEGREQLHALVGPIA